MNEKLPRLDDLEKTLLELGFKEVTKDLPISFCETIQGWNSLFYLSKRYARTKDGMTTLLNIGGDSYYRLQFTGMSVFEGCSNQFASEIHKTDFELVVKYINANEEHVRGLVLAERLRKTIELIERIQ